MAKRFGTQIAEAARFENVGFSRMTVVEDAPHPEEAKKRQSLLINPEVSGQFFYEDLMPSKKAFLRHLPAVEIFDAAAAQRVRGVFCLDSNGRFRQPEFFQRFNEINICRMRLRKMTAANMGVRELKVPLGYEVVYCRPSNVIDGSTEVAGRFTILNQMVKIVLNKFQENLLVLGKSEMNPFVSYVYCPDERVEYVDVAISQCKMPEKYSPEFGKPDDTELDDLDDVIPHTRVATRIDDEVSDLMKVGTVIRRMQKRYRYFCNDVMKDLFDWAEEERQMGTLIHGLEMGFCEHLCWAMTVNLRRMGLNAHVVSVEFGSGKEFEAVGHCVVAVILKDGRLIWTDPTWFCVTSNAFHPKKFGIEDSDKQNADRLLASIRRATSTKMRIALLTEFRKSTEEKYKLRRLREGAKNELLDYAEYWDESASEEEARRRVKVGDIFDKQRLMKFVRLG